MDKAKPAKQSYYYYELFIWFFDIIFQIFFRTIRVRGGWRIPREGPVIFVGAPHANQFVDPVLLGDQVFQEAGRHTCFLIAEKSYKLKVIGFLARMMNAIPVGRAQDNFIAATGEIFADGKNPMILRGVGTKFTVEAIDGRNISFQGSNDIAPVKRVISDTELELARPFKTDKCQSMMANGFEPIEFKVGEKVDNTEMFHKVFEHLVEGGALGIFPEGGSHDRTTLLPLKPGVAIMALGAAARDANVAIVPVGMNYFHPHKFRSRAVLEFGEPLYINKELAQEYADGGPEGKKTSVAKLMARIMDALQLVTINCPDYETLMVVQAGQRLYKPNREHIPLSVTIEFTRRFVQGYIEFKEKDPRINELFEDVRQYNKKLLTMGISDHQVPKAHMRKRRVFLRLLQRIGLLLVLSAASLPGVILGCPILIFTKLYSKRKARIALAGSSVKIQGTDVIATWKILCSLVIVPTLFGIYAIVFTYYVRTTDLEYVRVLGEVLPHTNSPAINKVATFLIFFWGLHLFSYATIITGEAGVSIFKSLKPLYLALSPSYKDTLKELRETRETLRVKITNLVNELGPALFPDIGERLEQVETEKKLEADPRIDIRGLGSSLNLKGDYDLAKVSVFSGDSAPAVLRRRKRG